MADDGFVAHCLELLASIADARARRMFGGHGIYSGDVMFGLIAYDTLYLRVDDQVRDAFAEAGGEPFVYDGKTGGKPVTMPYVTVPLDAMDDPSAMAPWAERALAAALRARAAKGPARSRGPKTAKKPTRGKEAPR
ncbi:MAG: TfoX/Sxy family protein [Alphaproteobacteria bacterium]